jgi:poly(hydroxyalkanoate) depolymerase family esterase
LAELTGFGSNPGALRGWLYLPAILAPNTSLVVVLHGCTQTAASYDHGSGWTQLAEKKGFAVLFPEQQRANNANLCFNWFEPGDTRRDAGEALSIREMIGHVVHAHGIDPKRVFITGLSAGGAMANVMLATYPELFAGGALIGGLPYGVASGVGPAFERMHGRGMPSTIQLRRALETASRHSGPWPKVSIWHGTHDHTVKPVNAEQIAEQWRGVHAASAANDRQIAINGHSRNVWLDKGGREAIELYLIKGMAHGVPLATGSDAALGYPGPFMLDAGISSTARIAMTWGLADANDVAAAEALAKHETDAERMPTGIDAIIAKAMAYVKPKHSEGHKERHPNAGDGVGKVITEALRAAGLMK